MPKVEIISKTDNDTKVMICVGISDIFFHSDSLWYARFYAKIEPSLLHFLVVECIVLSNYILLNSSIVELKFPGSLCL